MEHRADGVEEFTDLVALGYVTHAHLSERPPEASLGSAQNATSAGFRIRAPRQRGPSCLSGHTHTPASSSYGGAMFTPCSRSPCASPRS